MTDSNEINNKIASLQEIVNRQSKLIASTGQKLIEIQVNDVKSKMNNMGSTSIDSGDFINNEDIVQLVTELQTQLDGLEDRSMRRAYNSSISAETGKLAPMTNKDGDFPTFKLPLTLKEFKELDKLSILKLGLFYEILLPNEEEIDQAESRQDIENINALKSEKLEEFGKVFDEQQVDQIFDELSRFFGISYRRGTNGY